MDLDKEQEKVIKKLTRVNGMYIWTSEGSTSEAWLGTVDGGMIAGINREVVNEMI